MPARRARSSDAVPAAAVREALARTLPPVVVAAGAERFFREDVLDAVVERALPEGDPGGALERHDAKRPEDRAGVAAAIDDVRSAGLFGGRKVIAIDNADAAAGPWSGGRQSPLTRLAAEGMASVDPAGVLVLLTRRGLKGSGALPKGVLKTGAMVVDCRALYDAPAPWQRDRAPYDHELAHWIVRRLQDRHGRRIGLPDAHALSRLVGSDVEAIDGALATLVLYVGEKETVEEADVHEALGTTRSDPIWHLVDATTEGRLDDAVAGLGQAFARGLPDGRGGMIHRPEALFAVTSAALHASWRQMLQVAEALARDEDAGEVLRGVGIPSFRADAFLARCRVSPRALLARHRAFFAAERGVKGGGMPPRVALERLVVALATVPRATAGAVGGRP